MEAPMFNSLFEFFHPSLARDKITCIEDLRKVAKMRVPKMFYDYCDTGSWTQGTYLHNESAFQDILLKQRVAINMENRTLATKMIGQDVHMPCALAPIGSGGMQHADGEILAARAAEKFGVPYTLSTMSVCSIEDVADKVSKPFWFQLYVMNEREFMYNLMDRAKAAECSALVLTLDLQVLGNRYKDIKNGLSTPPKPTIPNIINLAAKPWWCWDMLYTPRRTFRNIVGHAKSVTDLSSLSSWTAEQFDLGLNWELIDKIRDYWGGKLILKGIMEPEDAVLAVEHGADAIIVSNHGGRQLDGAPPTIDRLPRIVQEVGDKLEVWIDSGIRSGQDVLKAIALGAKGTMLGRAYIYGLGAYGQEGVEKALNIIYNEMSTTMAFCGHTDIKNVDSSILLPGTYPLPDKFTNRSSGQPVR